MFQLEKQQKKLEAKGINVELSQLRLEWEAARNGGRGGNNAPIQDHEIDVVGDDESDDDDAPISPSPEALGPPAPFGSLGPMATIGPMATSNVLKLRNNFSIDNLLAVRSTLFKEDRGMAGHVAQDQGDQAIKQELQHQHDIKQENV